MISEIAALERLARDAEKWRWVKAEAEKEFWEGLNGTELTIQIVMSALETFFLGDVVDSEEHDADQDS